MINKEEWIEFKNKQPPEFTHIFVSDGDLIDEAYHIGPYWISRIKFHMQFEPKYWKPINK